MKKNSKLTNQNLVLGMLDNVPFDGWNWEAIYKSVEELNNNNKKLDENEKNEVRSFFKNDLIETIKIFNDYLDEKMLEKFIKSKHFNKNTPEKIKHLILYRLHSGLEHKESIRSSIGLMSLPQNSKKSLLMLYKTCDKIWRASGDESTDFSFYTKRIILSGVYTSTLLFWINDESNGLKNTEKFLDRRLKDVSKIGKFKDFGKKILNKDQKLAKLPFELMSSISKKVDSVNLRKLINNFKYFK